MSVVVVGNGAVALHIAWAIHRRDPARAIAIVGPRSRPGSASLAAAAMLSVFGEIEGPRAGPGDASRLALGQRATELWPDNLRRLARSDAPAIHNGPSSTIVNDAGADAVEDRSFDAIHHALDACDAPYTRADDAPVPGYAPARVPAHRRVLHLPNEGWLNPVSLIAALEDALSAPAVRWYDHRCAAVLFHSAGGATGVRLANGDVVPAADVVLAPGAAFTELIAASALPVEFPRVFFGKGITAVFETERETPRACVRTAHRGLLPGVYAVPRSATTTLVGATSVVLPSADEAAEPAAEAALRRRATDEVNSAFGPAKLRFTHLGFRPVSEDGFPLIGRAELPHLYVATGTRRDGLQMSPAIAEHITALLYGDAPVLDLRQFAPNRTRAFGPSRAACIARAEELLLHAAAREPAVVAALVGLVVDPSQPRSVQALRDRLSTIHDAAGAHAWGIPTELLGIYSAGQGARVPPGPLSRD